MAAISWGAEKPVYTYLCARHCKHVTDATSLPEIKPDPLLACSPSAAWAKIFGSLLDPPLLPMAHIQLSANSVGSSSELYPEDAHLL